MSSTSPSQMNRRKTTSTHCQEVSALGCILEHMLLSPSYHCGNMIEIWPLTCDNAKSLFQQFVPNYIRPFHLHALFWKLGMIKVSYKGQPTIVAGQISQLETNEIYYNFASLKVKVSNRRVHEKKCHIHVNHDREHELAQ